jgi:hypothetical protein
MSPPVPDAALPQVPPDEQPLDAVLRPAHHAWIREVEVFLQPAETGEADFWTRLGAVRYLSDDFRERYHLEGRLLDELRVFLAPEIMQRLAHQGDRVRRERLALDRIGRRRGTAEEVALGVRRLLDQLRTWLAEIEAAVAGLRTGDLPDDSLTVLAHLQAFGAPRP